MFRLSGSKNLNLAKVYRGAESLADNLPLVKKVRRRRHLWRVFKALFLAAVIGVLLLVIVFAAHFMSLKSVMARSLDGKSALENAIGQARGGGFKSAQSEAATAASEFAAAASELKEVKSSPVIRHIGLLRSQVEQLEYLVGSAEMLSRAVREATGFGQELQNLLDGSGQLNYASFSPAEKERVLARIERSAPELNGMKANLDLALINLDRISYPGILWPLKWKIDEIRIQVGEASDLLARLTPLSQILPALSGYPGKATYLVLFQNNDELRPTGGFLGTYGILETHYGDILRFDTHDIYHMDMPVKDKVSVAPPEPIRQYLNPKWYMRDANWSPDWPTAAQKIDWFYHLEDPLLPPKDQINNFSGEFDGVIAVTPDLAENLLSIVGPVVIDGQEYNERNFVELLQYRVERGFIQLGIPSWQRKEVIGRILKEVKERLLNLPASEWRRVVAIFDRSIAEKDLLVYLKDPVLQSLAREQGWTGEVKQTEGDYLMVVDANLASLKTDAVMNRSISYQLFENGGQLAAKAVISYAHRGRPDWKTSHYQTYTRVYVPQGSRLVRMDGCQSPVDTYDELGKTVFGCRFMVGFNQVHALALEYELPVRLKQALKSRGYSLVVQKQPGSQVSEVAVDLSFANGIKSYSPVGFSVDFFLGNRLGWTTDGTLDRYFNLSF